MAASFFDFRKHFRLTPSKSYSQQPPWGEEFYFILKERSRVSGAKAAKKKGVQDLGGGTDLPQEDADAAFFHACEFGDIPTVEDILDTRPDIDKVLKSSDVLGRTPLRLSVENEHLEIVLMLLDHCSCTDMYEALLLSIVKGHQEISEAILRHKTYNSIRGKLNKLLDSDIFPNEGSEDSQFSSDINPLILAAQYNRFEIVQLLLMRGERIQKPHHYYCLCSACRSRQLMDQLRFCRLRLDTYRGLASEAYISLSSRDPILTAFQLANELRQVANMEKHFKMEYNELAKKLSNYVVQLIDRVRGNNELELVMNKTGKKSYIEEYDQLARLKLAIEYNEKKFVAHPFCQQKLINIWYSDLREQAETSWILFFFYITILVFVYPILSLIYFILPDSKVGLFMKKPCIKLFGTVYTYMAFLLIVFLQSVMERQSGKYFSTYRDSYHWYRQYSSNVTIYRPFKGGTTAHHSLPNDFRIRLQNVTVLDMFITVWVLGFFWQECKQMYSRGLRLYSLDVYNLLDTAMLVAYISSFVLKFVCLVNTHNALSFFESEENWIQFSQGSQTASKQFYWLIADRFLWVQWDPWDLQEGLFAIGNVLSFSRGSYLLAASDSLGPLQVSLAKMIGDLLKFFFIFAIVFVAFMVGLHNLYWYYDLPTRQTVEFHKWPINVKAQSGFSTLELTFRTMFWAMFGLGEASVVQINPYEKKFTESVGYILYGAYSFAVVIVLLTMLIAMMSSSYEEIRLDSDTEWKYARSKLFVEFIDDGATLPVPFNIFPTPKSIIKLCKQMVNNVKRKTRGEWSFKTRRNRERNEVVLDHLDNINQTFYLDDDEQDAGKGYLPGPETLTYETVMRRIVKRFIFETENDVEVLNEELKQDISSFRFEVLNTLQKSQQHHEGTSQQQPQQNKQQHHNQNIDLNETLKNIQDSLNELHETLARTKVPCAPESFGKIFPSKKRTQKQRTARLVSDDEIDYDKTVTKPTSSATSQRLFRGRSHSHSELRDHSNSQLTSAEISPQSRPMSERAPHSMSELSPRSIMVAERDRPSRKRVSNSSVKWKLMDDLNNESCL